MDSCKRKMQEPFNRFYALTEQRLLKEENPASFKKYILKFKKKIPIAP